jgi:hypothetical protein
VTPPPTGTSPPIGTTTPPTPAPAPAPGSLSCQLSGKPPAVLASNLVNPYRVAAKLVDGLSYPSSIAVSGQIDMLPK